MDNSFGFPRGGDDDGQLELPPGFRFHPTDEELVTHYLSRKAVDHAFSAMAIGEVDLNKCEPWDLPWWGAREKERYFFCVRDRKYPAGVRTNRATDAGYWKATGKDKEVRRGKSLVGRKKTLVFYGGRAPKGERTSWVMHEYRLDGSFSLYNKASKNEWVICRVFQKGSSSSAAAAAAGGDGGKHVPGLQARTGSSISSHLLPPLTGFHFPCTGGMTVGATPAAPGVAHVTCFSNAAVGHRSHETLTGYHSSLPLTPATPYNPSPDAWGETGLVQPLPSHGSVMEELFSKAKREVGLTGLQVTGPASGINPEISSPLLSNCGVSRQHCFHGQATVPYGPSGNLPPPW